MYSVHNSSLTSPNTPHGHLLAYWELMKDRSNESNLECSVKLLQTSKLIGVSNQQLSLHLGVPRRSNSKCKIWMRKRSMHSKCHVDMITGSEVPIYGVAPRALPNKPSGNPWWRGTPHPDPSSLSRDSGEWDPNHRCKAQVLLSFLLMVMVPMCHLELVISVFVAFFFGKKSGKGTLCVFFLVFCLFF